MGQGAASVIYKDWAGSAGHAPVMHDRNAYSCGIGSVMYESTRYWVLVTSADEASTPATTTGMKYGVTRNIKAESSRIKFYMWDGYFDFNGSEQAYVGNYVYYGANTQIGVFIKNLYEPSMSIGYRVPTSLLTYSSDTPSILTVSANGVVTPKSTGAGSITVALKAMPDVKTSFPVEVSSNTIFKSPTITLSSTSFVYDGNPVKPGVTVKDCFGNKLVEGKDYTVEFLNNDEAGLGSVRVFMTGNYHNPINGDYDFYTAGFYIRANQNVTEPESSGPGTGSTTGGGSTGGSSTGGTTGGSTTGGGSSTGGSTSGGTAGVGSAAGSAGGSSTSGKHKEDSAAKPKPVSISKLQSKSRRKLTVKWKKRSGVSGYQLQYALNKKFTKGKKTKKVSGYKKTSLTLKKLKSRKTYFVRIRTYKKVNGKIYYSSWSKARKVRVK